MCVELLTVVANDTHAFGEHIVDFPFAVDYSESVNDVDGLAARGGCARDLSPITADVARRRNRDHGAFTCAELGRVGARDKSAEKIDGFCLLCGIQFRPVAA